MHLLAILLLMFVLPVICIAQDMTSGSPLIPSIGKWFVYWGVGWRLVVAGLWQLFRPSFTARDIFGITDPAAEKLVMEIGFGNLAIGITAVASLHFPQWLPAAALAGAIFYTLAGLQHVRNRPAAGPEVTAMLSDLVIAVILILYLAVMAT